MRKRALQASLILIAVLASAALWARQNAAPAAALPSDTESRIVQFLREFYAWGPDFQIKAEQPTPASVAGLYKVPISVTYKDQTDHATLYVSGDGKYLLRGRIDSLLTSPYAANIAKLDLPGHPFIGPAKAWVNVVEFSDFECPHCREAHEGMVKIEPQYPQVRFTFMDFPLTLMHPWAETAAHAARCVYQEDPADYPKFRDLVFSNQSQINPDNAYTRMVGYATQLGLNSATFQACLASPATKKLVDADTALAGELEVNSTPTIFVNGRPLVGWNPPLLNQFITYELAKCQPEHSQSLK